MVIWTTFPPCLYCNPHLCPFWVIRIPYMASSTPRIAKLIFPFMLHQATRILWYSTFTMLPSHWDFYVLPTAYDWPPYGPSLSLHHLQVCVLSGRLLFQWIYQTFLLTLYLFRIKTPHPCLATWTTRNLHLMGGYGFVFLKWWCVLCSSYHSDTWKWLCWRSRALEGGSSLPYFNGPYIACSRSFLHVASCVCCPWRSVAPTPLLHLYHI